jgi:hypothetical protein
MATMTTSNQGRTTSWIKRARSSLTSSCRRERRDAPPVELQGDDAMVLMLGAGEHCPRERQHQRAMVEFQAGAGRVHAGVTILPNAQHDVYRMKIAAGAAWTFLADETSRFADSARHPRVHRRPPRRERAAHGAARAGLIVGQGYVGYWFWGRPSPYKLWDDLGELFARIKPDFDPLVEGVRP